MGYSLPAQRKRRRRPDDLRLVRSSAQLSHRDRIPKSGFRETLAGRPAFDWEGHYALSRVDLARDAVGGGTRSTKAHLGPWLRPRGWTAREQIDRRQSRSARRHRTVRTRRVPLLPHARDPIRRRWQFFLGEIRREVQRRSRQRIRESGEPRYLNGRALLRWRHSERRAQRDRRCRRKGSRGISRFDWAEGISASRRTAGRVADDRARQRVRGSSGAVEAGQGSGARGGVEGPARDPDGPAHAAGRGP